MQVTFGPKVARRVLRYELERLAAQSGKTYTELGARIGLSRVGFSHLISGKNLPSRPALEILMGFFDRADRMQAMFDILAAARRKPGRQSSGRQEIEPTSSIDDFELFLGMESAATTIDIFEPMLITGLLQTEAYAREILAYYAFHTPGVHLDENIRLRMRRQTAITREEDPAELWCVIEEQALRRPIGSQKLMSDQYDHLLNMMLHSNVNLQVLPRSVGVHPSHKGAFFKLGFEDGWQVAYEETRRSAYYYDKPEAVADYGNAMKTLRDLALGPEQSRDFISKLRKELE
jgi:hypothetical protein